MLTASEKVVAGDGVIRLKDGATTLGAYQATNANVTIEIKDDKSTIKVDFSAFLAEEKNYTLEVDENFVMAQDNDEPNSDGTWVVSVGDYTAPMLASSNPLLPKNGETVAVQLDADLTIKFNEPVQVAAGGMLYIYTDNGTTHGDLYDVIETADVTGQMTNTLVINTNIDFKEKTKYYVTIPEGAIVDYNMAPLVDNQNKFAGWLTVDMWAFTTRDATAPTVSDIMADNIGATSFDVFTTLNKAGKVYVMAVPKGDTPVAADFIAANGMKEAKVTDPAASVKVSLTQYFDGGGLGMVEGDEYDVWVITENAETVDPTMSAPAKKLTVQTTDVTAPTVVTYFPVNAEAAATVNEGDYI